MNLDLLANLVSYLHQNQLYTEARQIEALQKLANYDENFQIFQRDFEDDLELAYDKHADPQHLHELFMEYKLVPMHDWDGQEANYGEHQEVWDNIDIINALTVNPNLPPEDLLEIQKDYPEWSHIQKNLTLNKNTPLEALLNITRGPYREAAQRALQHPTILRYFEENPERMVLYEIPSKGIWETFKDFGRELKFRWDTRNIKPEELDEEY